MTKKEFNIGDKVYSRDPSNNKIEKYTVMCKVQYKEKLDYGIQADDKTEGATATHGTRPCPVEAIFHTQKEVLEEEIEFLKKEIKNLDIKKKPKKKK